MNESAQPASRPVAQHVTVLLHEAVDALQVRSAGVYVDGTFGRGGHSRLILQRLGAEGRLIAFDKDPDAIAAGRALQDPRLTLVHGGFGELVQHLQALQVPRIDGLLLDLGVSSPQLDVAERGFSFRQDGPLDMRMDSTQGMTAAEWLAVVDERELAEVIKDYGEERYAVSIAKAIVACRTQSLASGALPFTRTRELAALVASVVRQREPGQDPATRTFQAIRIHLNRELTELPLVLTQAMDVLSLGGRLAVISFHSLEDRIVKRFVQQHARPEQALNIPRHLPLRADQLPQPLLRDGGRIKPSAQEVQSNPRARSAVLRVAEKIGEPLRTQRSGGLA